MEPELQCVGASSCTPAYLFHPSPLAHSLYLDQPIGVGFSYGDTTTKSTVEAAKGVWNVSYLYIQIPDHGRGC